MTFFRPFLVPLSKQWLSSEPPFSLCANNAELFVGHHYRKGHTQNSFVFLEVAGVRARSFQLL